MFLMNLYKFDFSISYMRSPLSKIKQFFHQTYNFSLSCNGEKYVVKGEKRGLFNHKYTIKIKIEDEEPVREILRKVKMQELMGKKRRLKSNNGYVSFSASEKDMEKWSILEVIAPNSYKIEVDKEEQPQRYIPEERPKIPEELKIFKRIFRNKKSKGKPFDVTKSHTLF